jgi:hypothetical protein
MGCQRGPASKITVESTALTGETVTIVYERGLARPIHREIDHLDGLLYTAHMRNGVDPIPVEEYRQTGLTPMSCKPSDTFQEHDDPLQNQRCQRGRSTCS